VIVDPAQGAYPELLSYGGFHNVLRRSGRVIMATLGEQDSSRPTSVSPVHASKESKAGNDETKGSASQSTSSENQENLTDEDVAALLSVTWQVGVLTKAAWNNFVGARNRNQAAKEVRNSVKALNEKTRAFERSDVRPWKVDKYKTKRLAHLQ